MIWGFDTTMTHGSKRATTIDVRIAGFQWVQAGFKNHRRMQIARWPFYLMQLATRERALAVLNQGSSFAKSIAKCNRGLRFARSLQT